MINWESSNRDNRRMSARELAEKQIASCDAETIRGYAVAYATLVNLRVRRSRVKDIETRSSLAGMRSENAERRESHIRSMTAERTNAALAHVAAISRDFTLTLSRELLSAKIMCGDESVVLGKATRAQLAKRFNMLMANLSADAETAKLVAAYIAALDAAGVDTLDEVVATGATVIRGAYEPELVSA